MADSRQEQLAWVRALLADMQVSPTQLARRAGLSPSTLQRPLNDPAHEGMLSGKTIAAIADVAGVKPMEFPARRLGLSEPEVTPYESKGNGSATDHTEAAIRDLCAGRNGRDPWVMQGYALELQGILPGDVLIVDLNKRAEAGDVVCVQLYDWSHSRSETVMRVFDPPFLTVRSMREANQKPLVADNDRIVIKGVVISALRRLHAA